jgi:type III pantothenate kinase
MMLLFDFGNSRCKWARLEARLQPSGVLAYDDFAGQLESALGSLDVPARAVAVCVGGAAPQQLLADWLKTRWGLELERIRARPAQLGVTNSYQPPERLGADRWAALIGARARTTTAVCVVDCGTAITVDALDAAGIFRGGVILPGLVLQRAALTQGTQGIRETEGGTAHCLARTTADAVASGTLHGLAGAIDRIVDEQAQALGSAPQVFLTGGDGARFQTLLRHTSTPVPDLVLEGVARIAESDA